MDLEDQGSIRDVVEKEGSQDLVVLLGSPEPEAAEMYATTVTSGDPTYAGPLAGVPLGIPVYHIFEPEFKRLVPPDVYREQAEISEMALPAEELAARVCSIREQSGVKGII
jgi:betaine reductase